MELIGIVGTITILVSLMQKDQIRLRFINMIGSILFTVYGLSIGAYSVWILNGICIFVNLLRFVSLIKENKLAVAKDKEIAENDIK